MADKEEPPTLKSGPFGKSQSLDELATWVVQSQRATWDALQGIPGQPPAGISTGRTLYIEKAVATTHFYMVETLRLSIERLVVSNSESTRIMSWLTFAYVALTAAMVLFTGVQVYLALVR